MNEGPSIWHKCLAEFVGTFLLVFFGTGAVFVAVLTGELQGLFQVAIVWGIAIAIAIYATSAISGAHINPAVTLAMAVFRGFPLRNIIPYLCSQLAGGFTASATLYALFRQIIASFEHTKGIVRGLPGSQLSAMLFGEYFPNPAVFGTDAAAFAKFLPAQAFFAEALGTALLVFFVLALTDRQNRDRPGGTLFALFIGLGVSILIAVLAPLTQACLNPARDFGPRLFAFLAGWNEIAIPGPRSGFFTVYILAPLSGGILGGALYDVALKPAHGRGAANQPTTPTEDSPPTRSAPPKDASNPAT